MRIPNITQQLYGSSIYKNQNNVSSQNNTAATPQTTEVSVTTESTEVCIGHNLTHMTSGDMLSLANSFHKEGNIQDFMTMAVFSAQAALEDHPDSLVRHTWTTPRNEDGTFNLLAEIQAPKSYSTGSAALDKERHQSNQHLLNTLLSLPTAVIKTEQNSIDIIQ